MSRDDDYEEFGNDPETEQTGDTIEEWTAGMIGECSLCGLTGGIPEECRRDNGSAGCPRCGGDMSFLVRNQGRNVSMLDITREWRPGQTGRCNLCGLIARVFEDVKRPDGTARCEMCGVGTFEFVYGLPESVQRAPAPRPVYLHEVDGIELALARRFEANTLRVILGLLRSGKTPEEILNGDEPTLDALEDNSITRHAIMAVSQAENERRWIAHEPLLYSPGEVERLSKFVMLRVPLPGRMKITFPGNRGPVERWVLPNVFEEIRTGERILLFDGHYKAVEKERVEEEPRFQMARQFFPRSNALCARGIISARSVTGEAVEMEPGEFGADDQEQGG